MFADDERRRFTCSRVSARLYLSFKCSKSRSVLYVSRNNILVQRNCSSVCA